MKSDKEKLTLHDIRFNTRDELWRVNKIGARGLDKSALVQRMLYVVAKYSSNEHVANVCCMLIDTNISEVNKKQAMSNCGSFMSSLLDGDLEGAMYNADSSNEEALRIGLYMQEII